MSITDLPVAERLPAMLAAGYEVRQNEYNDWARDLYQPGGVVYVGSVIANEIELAHMILALRARITELAKGIESALDVIDNAPDEAAERLNIALEG